MRRTWDYRLYWWVIGLYSFLAVSALASGINSWDEETDYLGIRTQIAHAALILNGDSPDYRDIHADLEYYGTVGLFPAWLIWFIQQALFVGRLTLPQALFYPAAEHQLTGFYFISHLILALEFIGISWLVILISRELGSRFPWLAGCLTLLTPSLLGHSFVNPKDIPFALLYTAYTYSLLKRFRNRDLRWLGWSLLIAGGLINQKFVAIAPVVITETLLFFLQASSYRSIRHALFVPVGGLLVALLLQPASWGLWPWQYLREAFDTFARHGWGGCMWWGGACVGVNQQGWSTIAYLWNWWSVKLPLLLVFLIVFQLFLTIRIFKVNPSAIVWRSPWILVLSQILLVPALAVLRQSNLYDADRHTLFVYPALAVVGVFGFQSLLRWTGPPSLRKLFLGLCMALACLLVLDDLTLNPYQSAYLNEWGRLRHDHTTTSLDYWAVSAKESLKTAQLNGSVDVSPVAKDTLGVYPLFIAFRQLSGQVTSSAEAPELVFQVRNVTDFRNLESCQLASEVSRTLSTGHRLVMSRLWSCP